MGWQAIPTDTNFLHVSQLKTGYFIAVGRA